MQSKLHSRAIWSLPPTHAGPQNGCAPTSSRTVLHQPLAFCGVERDLGNSNGLDDSDHSRHGGCVCFDFPGLWSQASPRTRHPASCPAARVGTGPGSSSWRWQCDGLVSVSHRGLSASGRIQGRGWSGCSHEPDSDRSDSRSDVAARAGRLEAVRRVWSGGALQQHARFRGSWRSQIHGVGIRWQTTTRRMAGPSLRVVSGMRTAGGSDQRIDPVLRAWSG